MFKKMVLFMFLVAAFICNNVYSAPLVCGPSGSIGRNAGSCSTKLSVSNLGTPGEFYEAIIDTLSHTDKKMIVIPSVDFPKGFLVELLEYLQDRNVCMEFSDDLKEVMFYKKLN